MTDPHAAIQALLDRCDAELLDLAQETSRVRVYRQGLADALGAISPNLAEMAGFASDEIEEAIPEDASPEMRKAARVIDEILEPKTRDYPTERSAPTGFGKRKCLNCPIEFTPSYPNQKYCGDACFEVARDLAKRAKRRAETPVTSRTYKAKPCASCGNDFTPRGPTDSCCSDDCRAAVKANSVEPAATILTRGAPVFSKEPTNGAALSLSKAPTDFERLLGVTPRAPKVVDPTRAIQVIRAVSDGQTAGDLISALYIGPVGARALYEWAIGPAAAYRGMNNVDRREFLRLLLERETQKVRTAP